MSDTNPFGVRLGVPSDAPALYDFVLPYYAESGLQPVSQGKLRALIDRCLHIDQGGIAGIVRGAERRIIASIGLVTATEDYTDEPHVRARWLYVHPDHRREPHATHLLSFAKWAQEQLQALAGEPMPLLVDVLLREGLENKIRSYQRAMPMAGAYFTWGIVDPTVTPNLPPPITANERTKRRIQRRRQKWAAERRQSC